jgi:putative transposase
MARKRYKPEEIVAKLRQVDVLVSQGQNLVDAIRQIGVSEVTYYRWRQEFGGLKIEQVKRLKPRQTDFHCPRAFAIEIAPCPQASNHYVFGRPPGPQTEASGPF